MGQNQLKSWQFVAERLSGKNPAGVKFEVVGFDNKGSPQESLNTLKAAIDQGFRYVTQGNGSGAALAISDAVEKFNERNPGKELVYLNYAAVDPALTNEKCNFWHFRLDADTTMKMEALTSFMKEQPKIKKVYIIGQNYSHGQQVAKYFKEDIARKRPDIQVVGDDLHPIGQVKDFSPYVAKIKQSGADSIVTGNWGQDLTLLVKALNDAGLKIPMYTYYAGVTGTPTALAAGGDSEVYVVAYGHANHTGELGQMGQDFFKKFDDDYYTYATYNGIQLLGAAMAKAKSTNPLQVARAMEGLQVKSFAGDVTMRASDHQLQQTHVHHQVAEGQEGRVQRRKDGLHVRSDQADGPVRVEHADQLPDEAPVERFLIRGKQPSRVSRKPPGFFAPASGFLVGFPHTERVLEWSSSPSRS